MKATIDASSLKRLEKQMMRMIERVVPSKLDAATVGIHEGAGMHERKKKRRNEGDQFYSEKKNHDLTELKRHKKTRSSKTIKTPKEPEPVSVARIGAWNHFGTEKIPARPWLDVGVEQGRLKYKKIIETSVDKGLNVNQAMAKVAAVAVGQVQKYMTQLKDPPNAQATIEKKGSSNPLIDSSQTRQSVTSVMTRGDSSSGV